MNYKNILTLLLLLMSILIPITQQRTTRKNYNSSARYQPTPCQKLCKNLTIIQQEEKQCLNSCYQQKNKRNIEETLSFVFPFVGLYIILWVILFTIKKYQHNKEMDKFIQSFNLIDQTSLPLQEFNLNKKFILDVFNQQKLGQSQFYFVKKNINYSCTNLKAKIIYQRPFLVQYQIKGQDHFGKWKSRAFLLSKRQGLFFWMFKDQQFIYQSENLTNQIQISGRYYSRWGSQHNPQSSGKWKIYKIVPVIESERAINNGAPVYPILQ